MLSIRSAFPLFDVQFEPHLVYGTDDERHIRIIQFIVARRSKIELMEPISADSPLATHLNEHGEGFHHLTPKVGDLPRTIENLGVVEVETSNNRQHGEP